MKKNYDLSFSGCLSLAREYPTLSKFSSLALPLGKNFISSLLKLSNFNKNTLDITLSTKSKYRQKDAPRDYTQGFQTPGSRSMEGIVDLHNDIMFYLILIFIFIF